MAKKPEPPHPITWTIYKIAAKQTWVGTVEAPDEATAMPLPLWLPARLHKGQCQRNHRGRVVCTDRVASSIGR